MPALKKRMPGARIAMVVFRFGKLWPKMFKIRDDGSSKRIMRPESVNTMLIMTDRFVMAVCFRNESVFE